MEAASRSQLRPSQGTPRRGASVLVVAEQDFGVGAFYDPAQRNVADRAALCGALPNVMKRSLYPRAVRDKERQRRAFEDDVFAFHAGAFCSTSRVTVKRTQGQGLGVFVNAPSLSVDELRETVQRAWGQVQ